MVLKIADYVHVLERGEKVLEGSSKEVMVNPRIYAAYLGGLSEQEEVLE